MPDLVLKLLAVHKRVVGYIFGGHWMDLVRQDYRAEAAQGFDRTKHELMPELAA